MIKCVAEFGDINFEKKVNELEAQGWKRASNLAITWRACGDVTLFSNSVISPTEEVVPEPPAVNTSKLCDAGFDDGTH
jgi:hypothetical protein